MESGARRNVNEQDGEGNFGGRRILMNHHVVRVKSLERVEANCNLGELVSNALWEQQGKESNSALGCETRVGRNGNKSTMVYERKSRLPFWNLHCVPEGGKGPWIPSPDQRNSSDQRRSVSGVSLVP